MVREVVNAQAQSWHVAVATAVELERRIVKNNPPRHAVN